MTGVLVLVLVLAKKQRAGEAVNPGRYGLKSDLNAILWIDRELIMALASVGLSFSSASCASQPDACLS